MKEIRNANLATIFDIEADGLDASKIYVLSYKMKDKEIKSITCYEKMRKFLHHHIDNCIPLVAHNGICYDVPTLSRILEIDLTELMLIDTLALSYYLNYDRQLHGLASFHEDYGIEKVKVGEEEWIEPIKSEFETDEEHKQRLAEHKELMLSRCTEDVKINVELYTDLHGRLLDMYSLVKDAVDNQLLSSKKMSEDEEVYIDNFIGQSVDEHVNRCLTFLMFKMDMLALKEATGWKLDEEYLEEAINKLLLEVERISKIVKTVLPKVPKYAFRKKPTQSLYKKDGSVRQNWLNWWEVEAKLSQVDELGNPLARLKNDGAEVVIEYNEPNVGSNKQIKDFLFSKGWKPETFKYNKDNKALQDWADGGFKKKEKPKPRITPQITIDGDDGKELCPSVLALGEEHPEILHYAKYTTLSSRLGDLKGFKKSQVNGYVKARIKGFTNTLRVRHTEIANPPSIDKEYGELIRGVLTCEDDEILLGSDLSSLEDRVKHHFMMPYDAAYVATMMADDYDPHIATAHSAGLITDEELRQFKLGNKTDQIKAARKAGKATNYASVYGAAPATIARSAKLDEDTAKALHKGYWELNWSVLEIAKDQTVFDCHGQWLINPINGICYSLRSDKDRFSTLCQGTGSYFFDVWVDKIQTKMLEKFKTKRLVGDFHDEYITRFKDSEKAREAMKKITIDAIEEVNEQFNLRRKLGCDVQFGKRYSEIH